MSCYVLSLLECPGCTKMHRMNRGPSEYGAAREAAVFYLDGFVPV